MKRLFRFALLALHFAAAAAASGTWAAPPTTMTTKPSTAPATAPVPSRLAGYHIGADLSGMPPDARFIDGGVEKPGLQVFRDHGYNWVRYRLWHTPTRGPQNLAYVIARAKEAKALGFRFLLNFHYSDHWADPLHQPVPAAWEKMDAPQMTEALFAYTRDTIAAFRDAGVLPDMVQVGNEIGNGMLFPLGKVRDWRTKETSPQNWPNLIGFIRAGINGVDAGREDAPRPQIMIHIDAGGDVALTRWFFDHVRDAQIPYDVIGLSYYPWSHGTLLDLRENLAFAAGEYERDVIVVETGYFKQPGEYFRNLPGPFPETPLGQRQFLEAVNDLVLAAPNGRGKGVYWWEPGNTRGRGFFDADRNALPVLEVFHKWTRPIHRTDGQ